LTPSLYKDREEVVRKGGAVTSIQPELWVETPGEAVAFDEAAFGATVLHRVGEGEDVVAQLGVGDRYGAIRSCAAPTSSSVGILSA